VQTFRVSAQDGASVHVSHFGALGGAEEYHLHVLPARTGGFEEQLSSLEAMYERARRQLDLDEETAVFRRVFLSDAAAQEPRVRLSGLARDEGSPLAISLVQQQPLPEMKVALWAYHVRDRAPLQKRSIPNGVAVRRGARAHLWTAGIGGSPDSAVCSSAQTREAFQAYCQLLADHQATLRDDVVRTWLYVQGIDLNYQGMVEARRELFASNGLTDATHFIASTGIEGRRADHQRVVLLDAYAIAGVDARQMRYLAAPEHLGPTSAYGVTFERGTRVEHADRVHVFISGTASIDPAGRTLHVADVRNQIQRTFRNVEALLRDGGASGEDIAQMLVYLRDPADRPVVEAFLAQNYAATPALLLHAPVCRPSWLVEVECIAIMPGGDPRWEPF